MKKFKNNKSNLFKIALISFIGIFLVLFLAGCEEKNDDLNDKTTSVKTIDNTKVEQKTNFNLGTYIIQIDKNILNEEDGVMGDEDITFSDDNKFIAYTGFGNGISGTYKIVDNRIECIANESYSEYGPNQNINATLSFKINNDSEIELIDTSEYYTIRLIDIPNGTLTNETKDMSLWPFLTGIKFILAR